MNSDGEVLRLVTQTVSFRYKSPFGLYADIPQPEDASLLAVILWRWVTMSAQLFLLNCRTVEDERAAVIWNVSNFLPSDTVSHPRRLASSAIPLWKTRNLTFQSLSKFWKLCCKLLQRSTATRIHNHSPSLHLALSLSHFSKNLSQSNTVGSRFTTVCFTTISFTTVVHHCRNSSVLSVLSSLLVLFRCACISSFSILVQFF
jgi:hypothetical protein